MMVWLELGLQSAVDETLIRINRGHTYREFLDGYLLAREYPLLICVHVIIGLPGENRSHVLTTAHELARLKPDGIKIHSLYIHRGTALDRLFLQGNYQPLQQHEFVDLACDMLELLPRETIIHRLTGDPRRMDLVAPAWTLQKNETLKLINEEFSKRESRQEISGR
jgi:radical SAM protein (TIGR01212 family)